MTAKLLEKVLEGGEFTGETIVFVDLLSPLQMRGALKELEDLTVIGQLVHFDSEVNFVHNDNWVTAGVTLLALKWLFIPLARGEAHDTVEVGLGLWLAVAQLTREFGDGSRKGRPAAVDFSPSVATLDCQRFGREGKAQFLTSDVRYCPGSIDTQGDEGGIILIGFPQGITRVASVFESYPSML